MKGSNRGMQVSDPQPARRGSRRGGRYTVRDVVWGSHSEPVSFPAASVQPTDCRAESHQITRSVRASVMLFLVSVFRTPDLVYVYFVDLYCQTWLGLAFWSKCMKKIPIILYICCLCLCSWLQPCSGPAAAVYTHPGPGCPGDLLTDGLPSVQRASGKTARNWGNQPNQRTFWKSSWSSLELHCYFLLLLYFFQ